MTKYSYVYDMVTVTHCVSSMELNAGRLYRDFKLRKKKGKGDSSSRHHVLGDEVGHHVTHNSKM